LSIHPRIFLREGSRLPNEMALSFLQGAVAQVMVTHRWSRADAPSPRGDWMSDAGALQPAIPAFLANSIPGAVAQSAGSSELAGVAESAHGASS
jgi:hypothetical protein